MNNIRFYDAPKYKTSDYELIENCIYKTYDTFEDSNEYLGLKQLDNNDLAEKLLQLDGWVQGTDELTENLLILKYDRKKYYRDIDKVGKEDDIVFVNINEDTAPKVMYVTSIVFEPEPEYGENAPEDAFVSQYPLEDILDKYLVYCYDPYEKENSSDKENSYVEFASENIDDIKNVLEIIGKHVYNVEEGQYVILKIVQP